MTLKKIDRAVSDSDWAAIREICCLTGNAGEPISQDRWPFFGEFWTGAYRKIFPDWTWVARDGEKVMGYLTGCPDTRTLQRKRLWKFELLLFLQVLAKTYPPNGDTQRFMKRFLRMSRGPEERFPAEMRSMLLSRYPAHLHINLRSEARGTGVGRELCEAFFTRLREERITGVHVFCGPQPKPFYEKLGFTELAAIDFTPTSRVVAMARLL